jgi:hypothetical protein
MCQAVKLVNRFIAVSVVNNMLNMISWSTEYNSDTHENCPVMFTHMRDVTVKNSWLECNCENGLRELKKTVKERKRRK